jgi:hypothetical protein
MAPVSVWTGHEMLIYGLVTAHTPYGLRGVLLGYTPATSQWRRLAPAPAPRMSQNGQFAAWTGTEMLVFGLTNAAYNPAANAWRALPRLGRWCRIARYPRGSARARHTASIWPFTEEG